MKLTIYVQDNCDHCKDLVIPESLNIDKVYINRDDFEGFKPTQVPILQFGGMNFEGPGMINDFLKGLDDARQGKYSK